MTRKNIVRVLFVVILSITLKRLFNVIFPSVNELVNLDKCPVCYGTSACADINKENFRIQPFDFHSGLSHIFNTKNVYYGYMGDVRVVIKKLASDQELDEFDVKICHDEAFSELCSTTNDELDHLRFYNVNYITQIESAISPNFHHYDGSGLMLCPTIRNLHNLIDELTDYSSLQLWTLIKINPEPIILKILKAEEGWPVPKYFGACGRIIIEEYAGLPLTYFSNKPWLRRAKIARDLIRAAHMFTFRRADFAFYWTDISPENIVVDEYDRPKFVDLENIIIVDKNISLIDDSNDEWNELHISDILTANCEDCFAFSPKDICSHQISDHNYYVICQQLLSSTRSDSTIPGGFLHNTPLNILNRYPEFQITLKECENPLQKKSRIDAGNNLIQILSKIIDELEYNNL